MSKMHGSPPPPTTPSSPPTGNLLLRQFARLAAASALTLAAASLNVGAVNLQFSSVTVSVPEPVGMCYQPVAEALAMSICYPNGTGAQGYGNFGLVEANGSLTGYGLFEGTSGLVRGIPGEIKVAAVATAVGQFEIGDVFASNGRLGEFFMIPHEDQVVPWTWIDSVRVPAAFAVLAEGGYGPDDTGFVRGIALDPAVRTMSGQQISGAIIACTTNGDVWYVTSAGVARRLAHVTDGAKLDAVLVLPNDSRYGPWANKILVGADGNDDTPNGLWLVDFTRLTNPAVPPEYVPAFIDVGTGAEDLDLIIPSQYVYAANYSADSVVVAGGGQFPSDWQGDILLTGEHGDDSGARMYRLRRYNNQPAIERQNVILPEGHTLQFEHVTFAPIFINPTVTVLVTPASVAEGAAATLSFVRTSPGPDLAVRFNVTGTAKFGVDYTAAGISGTANPRTIIIPAGQRQTDITVQTWDDSRREYAETMITTLVADNPPAGQVPRYQIGTPSVATLTITQNDLQTMPSSWTVVDLGVLGTGDQSWGYALNNPESGQSDYTATLVGASLYASGNSNKRAFKYTGNPGSMSALSTSPTYIWSQALGLNDAGMIVGSFLQSGAPSYDAFAWLPGDTLLTMLEPTHYHVEARAVNANGDIVGHGQNENVVWQAVTWDPDSDYALTELGCLVQGSLTKASYAYAVNNRGRVVGKSQIATSSDYHAYRTKYSDGAVAVIDSATDDLGTIQGYVTQVANDINDLDEVVGNAGTYAFLLLGNGASSSAGSVLTAGGSYTSAQAISNKGVVVGARWSASQGKWVPVLWWNEVSPYGYDFHYNPYENAYSLPVANWAGFTRLEAAYDVNDRHWIVGWGTKGGKPHGYLLRPTNSQ